MTVTHAAPFHLLADSTDGSPLRIRRTTAGDAWDRAEAESCAAPGADGHVGSPDGSVTLGIPGIRTSLLS